MKKTLLLLLFIATVVSCNNTKKETETETEKETASATNENVRTYRGEFIYTDDAAVLKGNNFIYGVTIDDKSQELADKVSKVEKDDYDMVPVIITGVVSPNPKAETEEVWEEVITIKEILYVSDKPAKTQIEIEEKKS
ncbi:MAG: hypothetical protein CMC07_08900 [Flavobacteriaceae bacterium]|jgi:hypothetical protein|nr:hypothetical protein [Flavobacteriaceae bacterium]|tara:strand:+ start:18905 stop:19318 length:414 start_codon:yes stop_codon:yes gene_type:complete